MSIIKTLLAKHQDALDAQTRDAIEAYLRRRERAEKVSWTNDDPQAGFVQIERVYTQQPTVLFGQDAPSLAHNQVTLYRAVEENGTLVPGEVLFTILVSEKSLTQSLFCSNSSTQSPATAVQLGDFVFPTYTKGPNAHDMAFAKAQESVKDKIAKRLAHVIDSLDKGGSEKARKATQKALEDLMHSIALHGELGFYVDQRLNAYTKRRTDLISELAHAALLADKIDQTPLLAAPVSIPVDYDKARDAHPFLDGAMDWLRPSEERAIKALLDLECAAICADTGLDNAWVGSGKMPDTKEFRFKNPLAKERIDGIAAIYNHVANPHLLESRHKINPQTLAMEMVRTHGWSGYIHCSLPATNDTFFTWRIQQGWEEKRFGDVDLQTMHHPLFEILLTSDDLMMALRGHPSGKATPCTLRIINGYFRHPRPRPEHAAVSNRKALLEQLSADPRAKTVSETLKALAAHMAIPATTPGWKTTAAELRNTLETAITAYQGLPSEGFAQGDAEARHLVGDMVKAELKEIHAYLPPHLVQKLLG